MKNTMDCEGSSNLVSVSYDTDSMDLDVTYKDGMVYRFAGVNEDEWAGLQEAESKGSFIHREIKRNHHAERIL